MKSINVGFLQNLKLRLTAAIVLAALVAGAVSIQAKTGTFSRLVVFGDSLSDTGNLFALDGGVYPPAPYYYQGRFCNGPIWVEYLAQDLGLAPGALDDYAVGGATTGRDNSNDILFGRDLPGLQDQIDTFLTDSAAGGADPDALYVVWAGANDFFFLLAQQGDPEEMIGTGVANTAGAVQRLWGAGARHILVANIADLGLAPYVLQKGIGAQVTELSAVYNYYLDAALRALQDAGLPTIQVDAFSTLDNMATDRDRYGFVNVTDAFLEVGGDQDQFLFWDPVHPTTRAHQVLARVALDRLMETFSPSQGVAAPPAGVNALHGLAKAANQH